ncbi:MAG: transketolase, partial [Abditibacteriota bacterium]|nr:transketolase [Abditibacteriota bacterium]
MSNQTSAKLDSLAINAIKFLAVDAINKAKSGHPGAPMGMADMAYVLWSKVMNYDPKNPAWPNRDRFILSGGHASGLLYALLHISGYGITMDDIKNFRQWGSVTSGHPEYDVAKGIEMTTGPLGAGVATAVGMAMAEKKIAATFNKPGFDLVNHKIYVTCGEGDLMEGMSYEAASLAGHFKLDNLVYLFDCNEICIEGNT